MRIVWLFCLDGCKERRAERQGEICNRQSNGSEEFVFSCLCLLLHIVFFLTDFKRLEFHFISCELLLKAYACSTLGVMKHRCASEHSCAFLIEKEAFCFENIP